MVKSYLQEEGMKYGQYFPYNFPEGIFLNYQNNLIIKKIIEKQLSTNTYKEGKNHEIWCLGTGQWKGELRHRVGKGEKLPLGEPFSRVYISQHRAAGGCPNQGLCAACQFRVCTLHSYPLTACLPPFLSTITPVVSTTTIFIIVAHFLNSKSPFSLYILTFLKSGYFIQLIQPAFIFPFPKLVKSMIHL